MIKSQAYSLSSRNSGIKSDLVTPLKHSKELNAIIHENSEEYINSSSAGASRVNLVEERESIESEQEHKDSIYFD